MTKHRIETMFRTNSKHGYCQNFMSTCYRWNVEFSDIFVVIWIAVTGQEHLFTHEWEVYINTLRFYFFSAGVNLTVIPSSYVDVNQSVTLLCNIGPEPPFLLFASFRLQNPASTLCSLEPNNGGCKNTTDPCRIQYNASCPSDTKYSIQVYVPSDWNGVSVICQSLLENSNSVTFFVKGTVMIRFKFPIVIRVG